MLLSGGTADPDSHLVAASIGFTFFALALMTIVGRRRPFFGLPEFRLGSWMMLFAAVAFGLATLGLLEDRSGQQALVDERLAPHALGVVAIGLACFTLGYLVAPRAFAAWTYGALSFASTARRSVPRGAAALVVVYAAGLVATALKIWIEGGYGYIGGSTLTPSSTVAGFSQPLSIAVGLRTAALAGLSARRAVMGSRASGILVAAIYLSEVAIALLSGVKELFVVATLALVIPLTLGRKVKLPAVRILAAIVVFVVFVTPFVTDLRALSRSGEDRLDAESSVDVGLSRITSDTNYLSRWDESTEKIFGRVRLLDNVIVILDKTPSKYPYRPISEVIAAPVTGMVPRAVWPDKPLRLTGAEFYETYYEGPGKSSSAQTLQGSLLIHGGYLPLIVLMAFFGTWVRALDDATLKLPALPAAIAVLIVFVPVVKQELDASSLLAALPVMLATYYLWVWAVTRPPPLDAAPDSLDRPGDR